MEVWHARRYGTALASLIFSGLFCLSGSGAVFAQVAPEVQTLLSATPMSEANPLDQPSREYTGLPVAGFLLYPSVFVGSVLDSNVFQTPADRKSTLGLEVAPAFTALLDNGIHKTAVYANGDFRLYPSLSDANSATGELGLIHVYQMQRDLTFRFQGDVTRAENAFSTGVVALPGGAVDITSPQLSTTYLGSASVEKAFDRLFVSLGGSASHTDYNSVKDSLGATLSQSARDGTTTTVSSRLGYWVTPIVNTFVEPSYNWQTYQASVDNSDGYRIVGGLNTDRISLFKGEIYGGYQDQRYNPLLFGDSGGGTYGGNIYYYPTPALTLSAQAGETLGIASITTAGAISAPTRTDLVAATAAYSLSRVWAASTTLTYQWVDYINQTRRDDDLSAAAQLDYTFWRDTSATLKYQFTQVNSNIAGVSFDRNVVSLGATYKY